MRFVLYLLRWQLSTPILFAVTYYLLDSLGAFLTSILSNFVGGCIFYHVDRWLFSRGVGK